MPEPYFVVNERENRTVVTEQDYDRAKSAATRHQDSLSIRPNLWARDEWTKEYHAERCRWLSVDNEQRYLAYGYKTRYRPESFEYFNNRFGYRTLQPEEIDSIEGHKVVALGCSVTYGIGLPEDELWHHKLVNALNESTDRKYVGINLGWPALSTDGVARMGYQLIPLVKPRLVVAYFPDFSRREVCVERDDGKVSRFGYVRHAFTKVPGPDGLLDAYDQLTSNEWDNFFNFVRSFAFLSAICKLNGADLVWSSWDSCRIKDRQPEVMAKYVDMNTYTGFVDVNQFPEESRARDAMHPGPEAHDLIAEMFYNRIKKLKIA